MSMTHCRCVGEAANATRMEGIATFTIVMSIDTMSRLRQQQTRMTSLRRRLNSSIVSITQ